MHVLADPRGNVTDEVIMEYIREQDTAKEDDRRRVTEESLRPEARLSADCRAHWLPAGGRSVKISEDYYGGRRLSQLINNGSIL